MAKAQILDVSPHGIRLEMSDALPVRRIDAPRPSRRSKNLKNRIQEPPPAVRYPLGMDISKMLEQLRKDKRQVEEAIVVLERLSLGRGKRRGRPPKWMKALSVPKRRGLPPGSKKKPPTREK